jgi:FKBP-type peptidyl-prolyl cis-trans isomerase FkpA
MKQISKNIIGFIMLATVLAACTKEYATIEEQDKEMVQNYIQTNNLTMLQYQQTGIYYQVTNPGTGPDLDYSVKIPLIYTVKTLDGQYSALDTFNNRYANYFGYFKPDSLREVIKHALVKQGGTVRVIIPSRFAFGKSGSGSIPGNSSLDYTITAITADKLPEYEDYTINQYLQTNNLTGFTKTASGLYYKIGLAGDGTEVIDDESVLTLEYTGKLFNGTVFDQTTTGSNAILVLGSLIEGWKEALPFIKKGGNIRILLPSSLGYGVTGSNTAIPPFSCLDFDIKVTDVTN